MFNAEKCDRQLSEALIKKFMFIKFSYAYPVIAHPVIRSRNHAIFAQDKIARSMIGYAHENLIKITF